MAVSTRRERETLACQSWQKPETRRTIGGQIVHRSIHSRPAIIVRGMRCDILYGELTE